MKISIVVPVYNAEKYINKLYYSIHNQTYKNYEIVFVNDGSTDNSLDILKKLKDDKVFIYSIKNSGPGYARKFGFLKATGDLIFFIDSDDWITSNDSLDKIVSYFENNEIDMLFFYRETICDGKQTNICAPILNFKINNTVLSMSELCGYSVRGGLGTKIFKRKLLKESYFISTSNFEDFYTTYKYMDNVSRFLITDDIYYSINISKDNDSLTKKMNFDVFSQSFDILLRLFNELQNDNLKKSLIDVSIDRCILYTKLYIKRYYNRNDLLSITNKLNNLYDFILLNNNNNANTHFKTFKDKIVYYIFILLIKMKGNSNEKK